jgi:HK97 family phage major capsid protein
MSVSYATTKARTGETVGLLLRALALADPNEPESASAFLASQGRAAAQGALTHLKNTITSGALSPSPAKQDFLEVYKPLSALMQLPLRRVPFGVRTHTIAFTAAASTDGESMPIPVLPASLEDFTTNGASLHRTAGIVLMTKEAAESGGDEVESGLAQALAQAVAASEDGAFLADLANAATDIPAAGSSLAQTDSALLAAIAALGDVRNARWVLPQRTHSSLQALRGSGGAKAYPELDNLRLLGLPVVVAAAAIDAGSPPEATIFLVDPAKILYSDGGLELSRATEANVQATATPTDPPSDSVIYVSLFQRNLIGLRAVRYGYWNVTTNAVAMISGVAL